MSRPGPLIFLLLPVFLAVGCNNGNHKDNTFNFEFLEFHASKCIDETTLDENYGFNCANQYIDYVYTNRNPINEYLLQNAQILQADSASELTLSKEGISRLIAEYMDGWIQESMDEIHQFNNDFELESGLGLGYESHIKYNFAFMHKQYFVLDYLNYYWSGGAHGMYMEQVLIFDLEQDKKLMLDDILVNNSARNALAALLKNTYLQSTDTNNNNLYVELLKEQYEEDASELLVENFYFDQNGIVFLYPPYMLGPYSEGTITLEINYSALDNIIKEKYITDFMDFEENYSFKDGK